MTSVQISSANVLLPTPPPASPSGPVIATPRDPTGPRQPAQKTDSTLPAANGEAVAARTGRPGEDAQAKAEGEVAASRSSRTRRSGQPAKDAKGQAAAKTALATAAAAESPFATLVRRLSAQEGGEAPSARQTSPKPAILDVTSRTAAAKAALPAAKPAPTSTAKTSPKADPAATKSAEAKAAGTIIQPQAKAAVRSASASAGKAAESPSATGRPAAASAASPAARTAGQTAASPARSDRSVAPAADPSSNKPATIAQKATVGAETTPQLRLGAPPTASLRVAGAPQTPPQTPAKPPAADASRPIVARFQTAGQTAAAPAPDASADKSAAAQTTQAKLAAGTPPPAHQGGSADALRAVEGAGVQATGSDPAGAAQATRSAGADAAQAPDRPVLDQIMQSIQTGALEAGRQLIIRLNPPELGQVRLTLEADGGGVRGLVEVDNARTLAEIQREAGALTGRLADSGVELRRLDVQLSDSARDSTGDSALHQGPDGRGAGGQAAHDGRDGTDGPAPHAEPLASAGEQAMPGRLAADQTINVWI